MNPKKLKILKEWGFEWLPDQKVYAKLVKLVGEEDKKEVITLTRNEVATLRADRLHYVIGELMKKAAKRLLGNEKH